MRSIWYLRECVHPCRHWKKRLCSLTAIGFKAFAFTWVPVSQSTAQKKVRHKQVFLASQLTSEHIRKLRMGGRRLYNIKQSNAPLHYSTGRCIQEKQTWKKKCMTVKLFLSSPLHSQCCQTVPGNTLGRAHCLCKDARQQLPYTC